MKKINSNEDQLTADPACQSTATCCVPGTAHVLKGESSIASWFMLGKSQTQPDGGKGCSVIATVIR